MSIQELIDGIRIMTYDKQAEMIIDYADLSETVQVIFPNTDERTVAKIVYLITNVCPHCYADVRSDCYCTRDD